jgi:hypothetical protein
MLHAFQEHPVLSNPQWDSHRGINMVIQFEQTLHVTVLLSHNYYLF